MNTDRFEATWKKPQGRWAPALTVSRTDRASPCGRSMASTAMTTTTTHTITSSDGEVCGCWRKQLLVTMPDTNKRKNRHPICESDYIFVWR